MNARIGSGRSRRIDDEKPTYQEQRVNDTLGAGYPTPGCDKLISDEVSHKTSI
jgi:hypothetical protein